MSNSPRDRRNLAAATAGDTEATTAAIPATARLLKTPEQRPRPQPPIQLPQTRLLLLWSRPLR